MCCWISGGLDPNSQIQRDAMEKSVELIATAAEKQGTSLKVVAEYLPPVAGSYLAHVGEAGKWVGPMSIVNTNRKVFQKCMQLSKLVFSILNK